MLQAQVKARRDRLWNPPNGRQSSELEIVADHVLLRRRREADRARAEELRRQQENERIAALIAAAEAKEAERQIAARQAGEVIPVIPRFSAIVQQTCAYYDVTHVDLIASRRTKDVVLPRQVVMYLARRLTTMSLPEISRRLGGRDHTTTHHGQRKIAGLIEAGDVRLAADIDNIKWELGIR